MEAGQLGGSALLMRAWETVVYLPCLPPGPVPRDEYRYINPTWAEWRAGLATYAQQLVKCDVE